MASRRLLLKNGTFLIHDANNHVIPTKTSVLIDSGMIIKIASSIEAPRDTEIIDCTDKIISPGFIDTHHHGWQTQLKGRHANEQLPAYLVTGNAQSFQYSTEDVFYGQLAAMLEGIAAGTTTIVDHAHITCSPEHVKLAIAATASSGIRAVFCYTPIMQVERFNPLTYHPNPFEDWVMQTFNELADRGPYGAGRVTLGFAFDFHFLPPETIKGLFAQVKEKGVKTITCHGSTLLLPHVCQSLNNLGLLDEHIIISHGGIITRKDAELIKSKGAYISSTPSTEMQMAMGRPYCFDSSFLDGGVSGDSVGLQDNSSFGVDCHSCVAGSIISEARIGLQSARNQFNEYYMKQDKTPRSLPTNLSVEAAFNLATIKGAEAVRASDKIGRIPEGYKADLVIFNSLSPAMVGSAQHDPVAAIILHSSPADIETVIIDGLIRKEDEKLLPVSLDRVARKAFGLETLDWDSIAKKIVASRSKIQEKIVGIDYEEAMKSVIRLYHVEEGRLANV